MKKWLNNKRCAYCGVDPATTEDHVFAVGFFHPSDRDNNPLPKAPACGDCNGKKSMLDEYAMSVLSFGGRHPSALTNFQNKGARRLRNNSALLNRIRPRVGTAWVKEESGLIVPTPTVPIEGNRLVELFNYVAKGLMWFHWGVYAKNNTTIDVKFLTQNGDQQFKELFARWPKERVCQNLRNNTVLYEGIHANEIPEFSAWRIAIYGGVQIAGHDPENGVSTMIYIVTDGRAEPDSV